MTLLFATDRPGVYLAEGSTPNTYHVLQNVGTPFAYCDCPAAAHGRDCKHLIAALELTLEDLDMNQETALAVAPAPAQPSGLSVRKDASARAGYLREQAALVTEGFRELLPIAQAMVDANLVPSGMNIPATAIVMLKAIELGIPPVSAFEFLYAVDNKVKLQGQMVAALVARSGRGRIEVETSPMQAIATGYREGWKPYRVVFTIEDLKKISAKRNNASHDVYPMDHMRWKSVARVGRVMFADVLSGMDVVVEGYGTIDSEVDAEYGDAGVGTIVTVEQDGRPANVDADGVIHDEPVAAPPTTLALLKLALSEQNVKPSTVANFLRVEADGWEPLEAAVEMWRGQHSMPPDALVRQAAMWLRAQPKDEPDEAPGLPLDAA